MNRSYILFLAAILCLLVGQSHAQPSYSGAGGGLLDRKPGTVNVNLIVTGTNTVGDGNTITITQSGNGGTSPIAGTLVNMLNSASAPVLGTYFAGGALTAGAYIQFDFGAGTSKQITEFAIANNANVASQGVWQWKSSNDGSTWASIGSTFTLTEQTLPFSSGISVPMTLGYRYHRLVYVSGNTTNSPWAWLFVFKISDYPSGGGVTVAGSNFTLNAGTLNVTGNTPGVVSWTASSSTGSVMGYVGNLTASNVVSGGTAILGITTLTGSATVGGGAILAFSNTTISPFSGRLNFTGSSTQNTLGSALSTTSTTGYTLFSSTGSLSLAGSNITTLAGTGSFTIGGSSAQTPIYTPPVQAGVIRQADGGTKYGPSGLIDGTATLPPVTKVLTGQVFGIGGTGSTGTYLPRRP